jgi:Fe2+ transport system protein B
MWIHTFMPCRYRLPVFDLLGQLFADAKAEFVNAVAASAFGAGCK